jgi:hypothetical protein
LHKNEWIPANFMADWTKNIWHRRLRALFNLDTFLGQLFEELKVKLERKKCDLVVIPCGVISQLQPRSVSVNVQFQDCLINGYEAWLLFENLPLTASGKISWTSASKLA